MAKRSRKKIDIAGGWYAMPYWFADQLKPVLLSGERWPTRWPAFEYIWRMSFGWEREWAPVSLRSVARNIGKSYSTARRAVNWLIAHKFVDYRKREMAVGRNKIKANAHEYRIAKSITDMLLGRIDERTGLRIPTSELPDWPPEIKKWLEQELLKG